MEENIHESYTILNIIISCKSLHEIFLFSPYIHLFPTFPLFSCVFGKKVLPLQLEGSGAALSLATDVVARGKSGQRRVPHLLKYKLLATVGVRQKKRTAPKGVRVRR